MIHGFRSLGHAQRAFREVAVATSAPEYLLWGLGVMLVVHLFNWIGITYFDQTYAVWYFQLAAVVACAEVPAQREPGQNSIPTPAP